MFTSINKKSIIFLYFFIIMYRGKLAGESRCSTCCLKMTCHFFLGEFTLVSHVVQRNLIQIDGFLCIKMEGNN